MNVAAFSVLEPEFRTRVERMVWCTVATVDAKGRPRSRILHPLWEGATGWILTARESLKSRHLARTPWVSLSYSDAAQEQVYADCRAEWEDGMTEKRRLWELFKTTPPPIGYDPALFWPPGPTDPSFGVLRLTPWRIELASLGDLVAGKPPRVWRP